MRKVLRGYGIKNGNCPTEKVTGRFLLLIEASYKGNILAVGTKHGTEKVVGV